MNDNAPLGIGGIILVVIVAVWLYGSLTDDGGRPPEYGSSPPYRETRPGSPAVYARLARLRNCSKLQREFDIADENHRRESRAGDIDAMLVVSSYMSAADNRMRELGCYG